VAFAELFTVASLLTRSLTPPVGIRVAWSDSSTGELWVAGGDGSRRVKIGELFWRDGSPGAYGTPSWGPGASRLAVWAMPTPRSQVLEVTRLRGPRRVEIWSRGDRSVFYVLRRRTRPRVLSRVHGRGTGPVAHTDGPDAPTWSADGSRLAFLRLDGNVAVVGTRTGRLRLLPTRRLARGWVYGLDVSLSPHGRRAAVVNTGTGEAWIFRVDDRSLRRFSPQGARIRKVAWSPDGSSLVYTRGDARGNGQLLVASIDGRRVTRLTNDVPRDPFAHFSNTDPVWSPDGSQVAFLSNRDGRGDEEVFVIRADGRGERRLTRGLFVTPPLRWSPDSRRVAFLGWRDPYLGIVRASGGRPKRLAMQPPDGYGYIAPYDFSWIGIAPRPGRRGTLLSPAPRHRIRVARDHAPVGSARAGALRLIGRLAAGPVVWDRLADLSPDGSLVSFVRVGGGYGFGIGVRSLVTGKSRILARSASLSPYGEQAIFSRDGRELVFRRWARLEAVDLATGRVRVVADHVSERDYIPLDGGQVAFVTHGGRIALVGSGRGVHPIAVRLQPDAAYAPSPDASRVLYASSGRTWLLDRRTGRRRVVAVGMPPSPASWSPESDRFALVGSDTVLYDRNGRRLGNLLGVRADGTERGSVRWSTDGRRLIVLPSYGGTRPPPQPVFSFSRATGRVSRVLVGAASPLVGPGAWIVFTRRDAIWLGRISGR
jgi:TolB protein